MADQRSGETPRRRLRVAWVAPALVAVMVGVLLAGLLPRSGAPPSSAPSAAPSAPAVGLVPWLDATPQPYSSPTPQPIPAGTPACTASQVTAISGWEGATGSLAGDIIVTNVGTTACVLTGPPENVELRAGVQVLDIALTISWNLDLGDQPRAVPPVLVEPGAQAQSFMLWSNWCNGPLTSLDVLVVLPDFSGPILTAPEPNAGAGLPTTPRCDVPGAKSGLAIFPFTPFENQPSAPEPQAASISLTLPSTAAAGQVLSFTVTLTNRGDRAASLDPCPTYTEDLIVDGRALKLPGDRQYVLNCAAIGPVIAPGESVHMEMRYLVPADVAPGPVQLVWSMGGPFDSSSAISKASVEITVP